MDYLFNYNMFNFPPPSPSGTSSSSYTTDPSLSPSPQPQSIPHVVCNAPLVAPKPLPYHSPTFLQFDLPDIDEDLSYPPYTLRSTTAAKRKHRELESAHDSSEQLTDTRPSKRRTTSVAMRAHPVTSVRISARRAPKSSSTTSQPVPATAPQARPVPAPVRAYPYNLRR
ncbi:hypothetical protein HGRIS_013497 [Hohenbuehelia grisea]|uniref:Uncharacterized protein n=1 Tax=Hohenbuehelia grisea TaxID=104357 RepID=A0ABR3IVY9_9AGAR